MIAVHTVHLDTLVVVADSVSASLNSCDWPVLHRISGQIAQGKPYDEQALRTATTNHEFPDLSAQYAVMNRRLVIRSTNGEIIVTLWSGSTKIEFLRPHPQHRVWVQALGPSRCEYAALWGVEFEKDSAPLQVVKWKANQDRKNDHLFYTFAPDSIRGYGAVVREFIAPSDVVLR